MHGKYQACKHYHILYDRHIPLYYSSIWHLLLLFNFIMSYQKHKYSFISTYLCVNLPSSQTNYVPLLGAGFLSEWMCWLLPLCSLCSPIKHTRESSLILSLSLSLTIFVSRNNRQSNVSQSIGVPRRDLEVVVCTTLCVSLERLRWRSCGFPNFYICSLDGAN